MFFLCYNTDIQCHFQGGKKMAKKDKKEEVKKESGSGEGQGQITFWDLLMSSAVDAFEPEAKVWVETEAMKWFKTTPVGQKFEVLKREHPQFVKNAMRMLSIVLQKVKPKGILKSIADIALQVPTVVIRDISGGGGSATPQAQALTGFEKLYRFNALVIGSLPLTSDDPDYNRVLSRRLSEFLSWFDGLSEKQSELVMDFTLTMKPDEARKLVEGTNQQRDLMLHRFELKAAELRAKKAEDEAAKELSERQRILDEAPAIAEFNARVADLQETGRTLVGLVTTWPREETPGFCKKSHRYTTVCYNLWVFVQKVWNQI
jgi:hypothetical protein